MNTKVFSLGSEAAGVWI